MQIQAQVAASDAIVMDPGASNRARKRAVCATQRALDALQLQQASADGELPVTPHTVLSVGQCHVRSFAFFCYGSFRA